MRSELIPDTIATALRIGLMISVGSYSTLARTRSAQVEDPKNQQEQKLEIAEAGNRKESRPPTYRVDGKGPLLVYISGLDGTGELFFKQAPSLAASYRVMTFRSRDSGRFTYEDLADDVALLIRDAGAERATIVAESFGGGVALTFALRHPAMVERLIIVNSFARFHSRAKIKLGILFASVLPFWLTSIVRKTANEAALRADGVRAEDRHRFFKAIRTVKRKGYTQRLKLIAELNLENRLADIHAPTLFIAGQKDLLVPSAREARSMSARMPNAQVRIIPRAGHACLLGDRVRLADILAEWIAQ